MKKRQQTIVFIFICYLVPVLTLSLFSQENGWRMMGLGLLFSAAGSLILYLLMQKWEEGVEEPSAFEGAMDERVAELQSAVEEYQTKLKDLQQVLDVQGDEVRNFESEKDQIQHHYHDLKEDYTAFKSTTEEELRRKDVLLSEYQETITQQRDVIKKRQEQITELEGKVQELSFEVKTLIDVAKMEEEEQIIQPAEPSVETSVHSTNEATHQLHRCIDIAQKITGANHFETGNSRFRDLHMDNYALDLRRLFDTLRSESSCTVFVFSQKENKLLFVNNRAKHLLGWSPEKFIQHFPEIIKESVHEWNRGISRLANASESTSRLLMKTRTGESVVVNCNLGIIPSGIFRNHIIGILYLHALSSKI